MLKAVEINGRKPRKSDLNDERRKSAALIDGSL
jgi:hypothetical protein